MSKDASKLSRLKSGKLITGSRRQFQGPVVQNVNSLNDNSALTVNQIQTPKPQCNCKVIISQRDKEIRELHKKYRNEIELLDKSINQLKLEVKKSNSLLEQQKLSYEDLICKLKSEIESLNSKLEAQESAVKTLELSCNEKDEEIAFLISKHATEIIELKTQHVKEFEQALAAKDKIIAERDEKVSVMKSRMAEAIGKNSLERQKQLDELKTQLISAADEARGFQSQLRKMERKNCKNCAILQEKLEEKILQVRLKEKALIDMQNVGNKMQVQLNQQDVILQKWEERGDRETYLAKYTGDS